MIKGTVKFNKGNKTKFVFLPKECGFNEGDDVEINFSGRGIYSEEELKNYKKNNKELFKNLRKAKKKVYDEWYGKMYESLQLIGRATGLGKLIVDEDYIYFEKSNYTFYPQGDIEAQEQNVLSDLHLRYTEEDLKEFKKDNPKLKDSDIKQQVSDYAVTRMAQVMFEETDVDYNRFLDEEFEKLGFKSEDENHISDEGEVWFSNGVIKLIIAPYSGMTITTMNKNNVYDKEPTLDV